MLIGIVCGVFAGAAGLTLSSPAPAATPRAPHTSRRTSGLRALAPPAGDVYSLRARRRFAAYLRLRLLEMREAGLERAANVVEHRLPVDTLLRR